MKPQQIKLQDVTHQFSEARARAGLPSLTDGYKIISLCEGMLVGCGCPITRAAHGVVLIEHQEHCDRADVTRGHVERLELGEKSNIVTSVYGIVFGCAVWHPFNGLFPDD